MLYHERTIIRDLAKKTQAYALSDDMQQRRRLWTDHNSLSFSRPLVYIRAIPQDDCIDSRLLQCTDPWLRQLEMKLLLNEYRMRLQDDTIVEPYLVVRAVLKTAEQGVYGLPAHLGEKPRAGGAAAFRPSLIEERDIEKIQVADYEVDEAATRGQQDKLADLVGDILPVVVDRQGVLCGMWANDISTILAQLRGLEQLMWDLYDRPEWLHRLLGLMQSHIIKHMDQTEQAGGFRLINHQNQAMPYARELPPPQADNIPVSPKTLWGYMASQETTGVGPDQFETFMFNYQKPILERYGLVAYGCCEDLTRKISVIRTLKNLRRIAVSPFAERYACAEQIGRDYVLSWRPDPSSHVSNGLDEDYVLRDLHDAFTCFDAQGCCFDITLKDVETVGGDSSVLIRWSKLVKKAIQEHYGK
ncbi:MAG: hypothetical protein GX173_00995 [Ruminococcaceae bacterium]|nr:hypothetical protein [Oscillospiraceae bacterium]